MGVSIRSPHGCKGRSVGATRQDLQEIVSIRSPHGCKGRSVSDTCMRLIFVVSIRSPHGCKGRYLRPHHVALCPSFNPLPSRM